MADMKVASYAWRLWLESTLALEVDPLAFFVLMEWGPVGLVKITCCLLFGPIGKGHTLCLHIVLFYCIPSFSFFFLFLRCWALG